MKAFRIHRLGRATACGPLCLLLAVTILCDSQEKYDSVVFEQSKREDALAFEAIKEVHRQMDDDLSGSVDLNESIGFAREELRIEEKDRLARRQQAFHENNDALITVDDLWYRWLKSDVRQWSTDDMVYWLVNFVELPQYAEVFTEHKVNGSCMPRLACPDSSYMTKELHISNPVHRHKLQLKALDVVLFGFRHHLSNHAKDAVLVTLLAIAIGGYWFAMCQRRTAQRKLVVLSAHLDRLKDMEQEFTELQKKMENTHDSLRPVDQSSDTFSDERRQKMQEMEKELDGRIPMLQKLLIRTYDIEVARLNQEKMENFKEMREAREWVEKLRKKHSSLMNQIRSVHGSEGEQIDRRVLVLKQRMERTARSLEEHHQRWSQIESVCGFPIMTAVDGGGGGSGGGGSSILPTVLSAASHSTPYMVRAPVLATPSIPTTLPIQPVGSAAITKHYIKSASDVFSSHTLPDRNQGWPVLSRCDEMDDLLSGSANGQVTFSCGEETPTGQQQRRLRLTDLGKSGSFASNASCSSKEEPSECALETKKRNLFSFKKMKLH